MADTTFDDPGDVLRQLDFEPQCERFAGDGKYRCKNHAYRHVIFNHPAVDNRSAVGRLVCEACEKRLRQSGNLLYAGEFV